MCEARVLRFIGFVAPAYALVVFLGIRLVN
jgi:hypothetical protein